MNSRNKYSILDGKLNVTGTNINYYRLKKGLSAQQLSDKLIMLGLDIITDYELCAIAEILGITTNDLLENYVTLIKNELK